MILQNIKKWRERKTRPLEVGRYADKRSGSGTRRPNSCRGDAPHAPTRIGDPTRKAAASRRTPKRAQEWLQARLTVLGGRTRKAVPSHPQRDELQERGFFGGATFNRWREPAYRRIGQKTLGEGGGITPGRGGVLDEGVSLLSDLSVSSGYTKRVQAGGEVPTHRGTSARIDACTVKNER
jgi:hypothetical protein